MAKKKFLLEVEALKKTVKVFERSDPDCHVRVLNFLISRYYGDRVSLIDDGLNQGVVQA